LGGAFFTRRLGFVATARFALDIFKHAAEGRVLLEQLS
jgi:hypothetical protein